MKKPMIQVMTLRSMRFCSAIALAAVSVLTMANDARAAEITHSCTISDVTVFNNRVHVRCSNPASNGSTNSIYFFAIATTNAAADRYISLATTALVSQKTFQIRYDTVYGAGGFGTVANCGSSDCRVPVLFAIK